MQANVKNALVRFKSSRHMQKITVIICSLLLVITGIFYWLYHQRYISTDDSYINANIVQIAPRISGEISRLYVINNQLVKPGELLFEIDPEPFSVAVTKAKAQLNIDEAALQNAQVTADRILALVAKKILPPQASDDIKTKLASAKATLQYDKSNLAQAELELSYTKVFAPVAGRVTNMSVRAGNVVEAGEPLFALIDNTEFWADANYKETQLEQVKAGQAATIKVDMYPQHIFKGYVESISGGSGTAFSLLPPQNATGNWVKVTQRVPVKIVIYPEPDYPLHIGTSAVVTIDIHSVVKMKGSNNGD